MDNNYLIPANSKKSMLILGFFNTVDLIIFGTGVFITFIFLLILDSSMMKNIIVILLPALIGTFLVLPVPHHHNFRTLVINVYTYFSSRRTYYWRGWCVKHGESKESK